MTLNIDVAPNQYAGIVGVVGFTLPTSVGSELYLIGQHEARSPLSEFAQGARDESHDDVIDRGQVVAHLAKRALSEEPYVDAVNRRISLPNKAQRLVVIVDFAFDNTHIRDVATKPFAVEFDEELTHGLSVARSSVSPDPKLTTLGGRPHISLFGDFVRGTVELGLESYKSDPLRGHRLRRELSGGNSIRYTG